MERRILGRSFHNDEKKKSMCIIWKIQEIPHSILKILTSLQSLYVYPLFSNFNFLQSHTESVSRIMNFAKKKKKRTRDPGCREKFFKQIACTR